MKIEIIYNNNMNFTAYLTEKTYENVSACLLDDISTTVIYDNLKHNCKMTNKGE